MTQSALTLVITTVGLTRFTAAQADQDIDLTIARVGLTPSYFVTAPTLTALPGEVRRLATVSGEQVGDGIVHMTVRDDEPISYLVRGFGLFLADGTLFAVYSQPEPILQKSVASAALFAIDVVFPTADVSSLTFGDTNFLYPPATTSTKGVVELATEAEADAGTPGALAVTAALLARLAAKLREEVGDLADAIGDAMAVLLGRTITGAGLVKGGGDLSASRVLTVTAATAAQVRAGTAADVALTPAALRDAYVTDFSENGRRIHPDGFVEMWGLGSVPVIEGRSTLVFPTPFPTACFGMVAMTRNLNLTDDGQTTIQELALYTDRAELFVQNHIRDIHETGGFRWRAWGY